MVGSDSRRRGRRGANRPVLDDASIEHPVDFHPIDLRRVAVAAAQVDHGGIALDNQALDADLQPVVAKSLGEQTGGRGAAATSPLPT